MALRPEEVLFIKYSLGVPVTGLGAEPYITYLAVFDQAIQPFLIDPSTTSTTTVSASTTTNPLGQIVAVPVAITVAAIPTLAYVATPTPAFVQGSTVNIDVGTSQEQSPILAISGLQIWVNLALAHGANGAYPVQMAGAETVVRNIITRLQNIENMLTQYAPKTAGVQSADKVNLYAGTRSGGRGAQTLDPFGSLIDQREQARTDLGEAIGFPNLRNMAKSAGGSMTPY